MTVPELNDESQSALEYVTESINTFSHEFNKKYLDIDELIESEEQDENFRFKLENLLE